MLDAAQLAIAMPFAEGFSEATRMRLRKQGRVLSFPPCAPLLHPGDAVSGAYFVVSGSIRVHYLDSDGREGTLYRIEPGQSCILALNCLFSEMRYPAFAEAGESGVSFVLLEGAAAGVLVADDPAFMRAMFEQVSARLYGLLHTLEQAIRLPLESRLIHLLLDLADEQGEIRLPQQRIASHLGTSREVVSRIVRSLVASGLIASAYGQLRIADTKALEERAG